MKRTYPQGFFFFNISKKKDPTLEACVATSDYVLVLLVIAMSCIFMSIIINPCRRYADRNKVITGMNVIAAGTILAAMIYWMLECKVHWNRKLRLGEIVRSQNEVFQWQIVKKKSHTHNTHAHVHAVLFSSLYTQTHTHNFICYRLELDRWRASCLFLLSRCTLVRGDMYRWETKSVILRIKKIGKTKIDLQLFSHCF